MIAAWKARNWFIRKHLCLILKDKETGHFMRSALSV